MACKKANKMINQFKRNHKLMMPVSFKTNSNHFNNIEGQFTLQQNL